MANGPEFFQTGMGQKFYNRDFPRFVENLEKLNNNLENCFSKVSADDTEAYNKAIDDVLPLVKDIKGFCRSDVLVDLLSKIEQLRRFEE